MADFDYRPTATDQDVARQTRDDEALLRTALARFQQSEEAEADLRREFLLDQQFRAGDQWPGEVRTAREGYRQHRPCLTINLIPGALAQITNEQRRQRPTIRVSPTGDAATQEDALLREGLLRHIQLESRADVAYDIAVAEAAGPGRGWIRVITEYDGPKSFLQRLRILSVPNSLSVYPQPGLHESDYSDMNWCFIIQDMSHDDFLAQYPSATPDEMAAWGRQEVTDWLSRDQVRVAEYYYREMQETPLLLLASGEVIEAAQLAKLPPGQRIIDRRTASVPHVYWVKMTSQKVLERTEWLGEWIPIVPVLGDVFYVGNALRISGIIRDARDSQRMINYWASAHTEAIALAPRAPWLVAEGQLEGYEQEWETSNLLNHATLTYKQVDLHGNPAPAPQRNIQEPAIQAISQARLLAANDFQATTRIYDASYGAPGNERSGRAIEARDRNADMSNSHYVDNCARALKHVGRILLQLLPKIYNDPGRVLRIVAEDGTEKQATMNQPHLEAETGLQRFYDLEAGRYDVQIEIGQNYATKRQESIAALSDLAKADPKILQIADDLVVSQMDFPAAKEIAARLRKTIPPQLLEQEQGLDKDGQLARAQGQLQQLNQEAQALNAHAGTLEQEHQQLQGQLQQLTVENQQLKAAARLGTDELALKREELHLRTTVDQQKLELEQQKLLLEQLRLEAEQQGQAQLGATQEEMAHQGGIQQAHLEALQETIIQLLATLSETTGILAAQAQRNAAGKTVTMQRLPDGTLVGEVHSASLGA